MTEHEETAKLIAEIVLLEVRKMHDSATKNEPVDAARLLQFAEVAALVPTIKHGKGIHTVRLGT